jgi:hypothetical protein
MADPGDHQRNPQGECRDDESVFRSSGYRLSVRKRSGSLYRDCIFRSGSFNLTGAGSKERPRAARGAHLFWPRRRDWVRRLFAALVEQGALAADGAAVLAPTAAGRERFRVLGVDVDQHTVHRPLRQGSLDWSECKPQLSGWLGARLPNLCLDKSLLQRESGSRALALTRISHSTPTLLAGEADDTPSVNAGPPA